MPSVTERLAHAGVLTQLLGCDWGRRLALPDDREPCSADAVQRVALHNEAYLGGQQLFLAQLCQRHIDVVNAFTDLHKEVTS